MMNTKLRAAGLGLLLISGGAFALAGCSSDAPATDSTAAVEQSTESDVAADLQTARQAVLDALADDAWAQVMLASDVSEPTVKYGLMVMPFVKTDAASRVTGTVTINDGDQFVIEADSAATSTTWQIDQDGTITEVTE